MARFSTTTTRLPLLLLGALLLISAPTVVVAQSQLDIVLVVDTTKSIGDDLQLFKNVIANIITSTQGLSEETKYGLATFEDYPFSSWGQPGDEAYDRIVDLTDDYADFLAKVALLEAGNGNDAKESQLTAIDQLIGGAGQTVSGYVIPPNLDMSFRSGAKKIICMWTDSMFNSALVTTGYPGASLSTVITKLTSTSVDPPYRFVGLNRDGEGGLTPAATKDLQDLADATSSRAANSFECVDGSDVNIASGDLLVCTKIGGSEEAIEEGFVNILTAAELIGTSTIPTIDDICDFGAFNVFCELFNTVFGWIGDLFDLIFGFFTP